jgi:hypothetical protein
LSTQTQESDNSKVVGFRVTPEEFKMLQDYATIFHEQQFENPQTGEKKPLLDEAKVGKLVKFLTWNGLMSYNYILKETQKMEGRQTTGTGQPGEAVQQPTKSDNPIV